MEQEAKSQSAGMHSELDEQHAEGAFPISVGTSLAIEKLFSPIDYMANKPAATADMKNYDAVYINISTLIRNAISATPPAVQASLNPDPVKQWVLADMQIIQEVFNQSKIPVIFYTLSYASLSKNYPVGTQRIPKTHKQLFNKDLYDTVIGKVVDQIENDHLSGMKDISLLQGDMSVSVKVDRPLFLTSTPIDVLEIGHGKKFAIIQSYTGRIIGQYDMYTMFQVNSKHKERSYQRIPFNRLFIQLFGDGKTFHQAGGQLLTKILDCADKHEWSQQSTKSRIKLTMELDGIWEESYNKVKF